MFNRLRSAGMTLAAALATTVALAAPGDLDTTYGTGGRVIVPVPAIFSATPDGRLLQWFDQGPTPANRQLHVFRLTTGGQADSSWGAGGEVVVDIGAYLVALGKPQCTSIYTLGLATADDGSVVVHTAASCGSSGFMSLYSRLRANGAPDTGFGGSAGFVVLADGQGKPVDADTSVVALSADGTVWIAEWWYDDYSSTLHSLYRISASGTVSAPAPVLDVTYFDRGNVAVARALPTGKIVIAGGYEIRRLNSDGTPDAAYGTAGKTSVSSFGPGPSPVATAIATAAGLPTSNLIAVHDAVIAADGSAVLAMEVSTSVAKKLLLARINASGQLDTGFGSAGVAVMDPVVAPWSNLPIDDWTIDRLVQSRTGELTMQGRFVSSTSAPRHVIYGFLWRRDAGGRAPLAVELRDVQVLDEVPFDGCCSPNANLFAAQSGHDVLLANFTAATSVVKLAGNAGASPGLLTMLEGYYVTEGGSVQVPVWRTAGSSGAVSLNYATSSAGISSPATAGSDYVAASGHIDWADGESGVKYFSLTTVNNTQATSTRNFLVNVSVAAGSARLLNSSGQARIEIRDTTPVAPVTPAPPVAPGTPAATSGSSSGGGGSGGGGALDLWILSLLLALVAARWPPRCSRRR